MAAPSQAELEYHVEEIGWSLVSMSKHLLLSKAADVEGHADRAQAAFDGAILHVRAIVEFLGEPGAHIRASHYCATWDGRATAASRGFDLAALYTELNVHAAHLSRVRFKRVPGHPWDLVPRVAALLDLFGDLLNCSGVACRRELFDQLTEARLHFVRAQAL